MPPGELGSAAPAVAPFFTAAQAELGRAVFESVCSACHALGEFRGQQFRLTWMARPLRDFVQHISTAMPQDAPGSLTPAQYAAVTAYFLQLHGQPPGNRELPSVSDDLGAMAWPR
jgi:alcohol dehydrogenase (cytochrome c)